MDIRTVSIQQEIQIAAPREQVWRTVVRDWALWFTGPEDVDLGFRLEAWPGGRLYRDLGQSRDGEGVGHLWAHVQVIKPPTLLELVGPMMISAPALSHVAFRLEQDDGGTRLRLTHTGVGVFPQDMEAKFAEGWGQLLQEIRRHVKAG